MKGIMTEPAGMFALLQLSRDCPAKQEMNKGGSRKSPFGRRGAHRLFAPAFHRDRDKNDWGDAINFDGESAGPVREFMASNAGYWIEEFHLDGLRVDATQNIVDQSPEQRIVCGHHYQLFAFALSLGEIANGDGSLGLRPGLNQRASS